MMECKIIYCTYTTEIIENKNKKKHCRSNSKIHFSWDLISIIIVKWSWNRSLQCFIILHARSISHSLLAIISNIQQIHSYNFPLATISPFTSLSLRKIYFYLTIFHFQLFCSFFHCLVLLLILLLFLLCFAIRWKLMNTRNTN